MNQNALDVSEGANRTALVDAHVHIHDCFDLSGFLDAAAINFSQAASGLAIDKSYDSLLCLTETSSARSYDQLRARAEAEPGRFIVPGSEWTVDANEERESVTANHPRHGRIYIVAGKQVVVAERLEVLALGCTTTWPDGLPASEVIEGVVSEGAIAVLPWGFGKWLGKRGRIVRSLIDKYSGETIFLGDNSGRPKLFREPFEFSLGRSRGLQVLPGTDPLPFPSESNRAGSFGFAVSIELGTQTPWSDLYRHLAGSSTGIKNFGRLESTARFIRNQLAMQYLLRFGGRSN